jgi:hypothetical protein
MFPMDECGKKEKFDLYKSETKAPEFTPLFNSAKEINHFSKAKNKYISFLCGSWTSSAG